MDQWIPTDEDLEAVYAEARRYARHRRHPYLWKEHLTDAYLGLLDALRLYDGTKGASWPSYRRRRIRGEIIDGVKRDWRRRELSLGLPSWRFQEAKGRDDNDMARRRLELQEEIETLPIEDGRIRLALHLLGAGWTTKEIGEVLGRDPSLISIWLGRLRRRLGDRVREALQDVGG